MTQPAKTDSRNLSLECCKLLAACFVVFLHIPFPGLFGAAVVCLSRFAVPLFFAVSGWYSYGASPRKLVSRLKHILLLELTGDCLYICWRCIREWLSGEALPEILLRIIPDPQILKLWLLWNVDPFAGHLWYLSATCLCYGVLWFNIQLRKNNRNCTPLYVSGAFLLVCCLAMSEFSRFTGLYVDYRVYRSGIFLGLPMFLLGMLLRQYRNCLRGFPMLAAGIVLSILEWRCFGSHDLYIGSVLAASGILLLTDRHPAVPSSLSKAAPVFGRVSATVYLIHLLLQEVYGYFFLEKIQFLLPGFEGWLQPVLILAASLLTGFLTEAIKIRK